MLRSGSGLRLFRRNGHQASTGWASDLAARHRRIDLEHSGTMRALILRGHPNTVPLCAVATPLPPPILSVRTADVKRGCRQTAGQVIAARDFTGPDLRSIAVGGHNLDGLNAKDGMLRDADFRKASLREADFRGANLSNAHFQAADLRGATLARADLE